MNTTEQPKLVKELARKLDNCVCRLIQLWEYKGRKFRFVFENSNGTPCGWDKKHCIMVFNLASDEWKGLADKTEILSLSPTPIDCCKYYGDQSQYMRGAERFMEACKKYIKLIY